MKVEDLKQKLSEHQEVMLLDVREADEVRDSPGIEGAQSMPMGKVFTEAAKGHLPKDKQIVTICKTGGRCEIVAKELSQKGYNIDFLEGGLEAWRGNTQ